MPDRMDLSAKYCPLCGTKVDHAEAVAADEEMAIQGEFTRDDACLIVEGTEIRTYKHAQEDDKEIRADGGVDGELLDAIRGELIGRGKDDPITAGELSEEIDIDDNEASPRTREALRVLIEERGVPIVSNQNGYWLIEDETQLEDYLESLDGRIASIQERKQLVEDAWENWTRREQATTDGGQVHVEPSDIRLAIKDYVENNEPAMRDDVTLAVSERLDCTEVTVQEQLENLEEARLCYIDDQGEVRLPKDGDYSHVDDGEGRSQ